MVAAKLAAPQTISNPASSSPHWSSFRQAPGPGRTSSGSNSAAALRAEVAADLASFKAAEDAVVAVVVVDVVVDDVAGAGFGGGYGLTGSVKVSFHSFQALFLAVTFGPSTYGFVGLYSLAPLARYHTLV